MNGYLGATIEPGFVQDANLHIGTCLKKIKVVNMMNELDIGASLDAAQPVKTSKLKDHKYIKKPIKKKMDVLSINEATFEMGGQTYYPFHKPFREKLKHMWDDKLFMTVMASMFMMALGFKIHQYVGAFFIALFLITFPIFLFKNKTVYVEVVYNQ